MIKKLELSKNNWCDNDTDRIYANQYEMMEKINEIVESNNKNQTKNYDWMMTYKTNDFTKQEADVIKKCLKYCNHRLTKHHASGLTRSLTQEDLKVFKKLMEKK